MRMRNKKNLIPRMERCAAVQVKDPAAWRGRWGQMVPGCGQVRAEVGCGKGAFTAAMAVQSPEALIVAIEKVPNAMVTAMERVCAQEIGNVRFIDTDAAALADIFAPGELAVLYINFPDPWPRKKEAKHRLTAPSFLALYWDALAIGGRIEYKTDQAWLFDWSLTQFAALGYEVREVTRDLHAAGPVGVMTNYEQRFHEQGVPICRCVAVKTRAEHAPLPEPERKPRPAEAVP